MAGDTDCHKEVDRFDPQSRNVCVMNMKVAIELLLYFDFNIMPTYKSVTAFFRINRY